MMTILLALISVMAIALAAISGRAHGAAVVDEKTGKATGWPTWGREAGTIYMSLLMCAGNYATFGVWWLAPIMGALTAAAFSTGHGRVYEMNGANLKDPNPEDLEHLFGWLYRGDITRPSYSWFIMGLKGLGVGLAIAPLGVLLFYWWPALYSWSFKKFGDSAPAEWATCGFAGAMAVFVISIKLLGA